MLPREQGKNAKVAQDKLKEIRESRDIPEDQKGFVAEEYMKNNHPQQWNMIQAGVQARQQSQQGEQPVGLLNSGQPGGQGIPPTPQVNGGRSGPQPGLLSMSGISPPLPQPAPQQSGTGAGAMMDHQLKLDGVGIMDGAGPPNAQAGTVAQNNLQPLGPNPQVQNQGPQNDINMPVDREMLANQMEAQRRMGREDAMANKTPNPATMPPPVQEQGQGQPGIFSRIGSGLQSAGQGMGNYAEKLFNDPNRMAMLQGGLSMMNPNSYYDQQGFGSVFQGLQAGLGQAQSGMQGVIDRKKARSDRALVDAKAGAEGDVTKKYKSVQRGDSASLFSDSDIQKRTTEIMKGSEGKIGWMEATRQAISETTVNLDKNMNPHQKAEVFDTYATANITLDKIRKAKKLVKAENLSGLATLKRGADTAMTFAQIAHNPSEATELKVLMDELAGPMLQAVLGIPLNSRLLDSQKEKDFIKDLAGNPSKYTDPTILASKLDMIERLYVKLQAGRRKTLGYGDDSETSGGGGYAAKYGFEK